MIVVKDLNLTISEKSILKDINMSLSEGNIYGLVGNNGCGKTMLMKCMCGFVKPTSGEVMFNDKQIGVDIDYPLNTGIIIETPGFIPYYTGKKNLKYLMKASGYKDFSSIDLYMEKCGLNPNLKTKVQKYSLGMRQRLGITQAIMEEQTTLILDEPMNGLDANGVKDIRKLLLEIKHNRLIILASHNKEDIDILCDHVFYMDAGEIINVQ